MPIHSYFRQLRLNAEKKEKRKKKTERKTSKSKSYRSKTVSNSNEKSRKFLAPDSVTGDETEPPHEDWGLLEQHGARLMCQSEGPKKWSLGRLRRVSRQIE